MNNSTAQYQGMGQPASPDFIERLFGAGVEPRKRIPRPDLSSEQAYIEQNFSNPNNPLGEDSSAPRALPSVPVFKSVPLPKPETQPEIQKQVRPEGAEVFVSQTNPVKKEAAQLFMPGDNVLSSYTNQLNKVSLRPSENQASELEGFKKFYQKNKSRYEAVAEKANMPPELIAALHWRESNGNFGTYLHQGDPLGRPAVHIPNNIPIFNEWEPAAVHALNLKQALRDKFGIERGTKDLDKLAAFAEYYNGLGYRKKGLPSPYVLSGTNLYQKGKYVADGKFDPNAVDKQLGVLLMIKALQEMSQQNQGGESYAGLRK
ncbi:MAG: hypothetical protein K1X66_02385 [Verrucomicrobiae bacterium]|nr:hypothetical protein [Verrucomicrobiae bacterium]